MLPCIHPEVHRTPNGVYYLKGPGVALISKPEVDLAGVQPFLDGFNPENGFGDYLKDPIALPPGEGLVKFAGQLCYMSLGPKRTPNAEAQKYLDHIKSSGHGSVLEHANYSFLIYGIDRSVTHELVRHRAGTGFSQLSQRYVSGTVLRFVERPEYQNDPELHEAFIKRIDQAASNYATVAENLVGKQKSGDAGVLSGESRTELRKKVQQCARSVLPNETETSLVMTGNGRAWRHVIEMRANPAAEILIRQLAVMICRCLKEVAPMIFNDHDEVTLPDETTGVETKWRKV